MTKEEMKQVSPYAIRAADEVAYEVIQLVRSGKLDSRCRAADASLEYALTRFGSNDSINDLVAHVEQQKNRSYM